MRREFVLALLVAILPACRGLSSKDVKTQDIRAEFTAVRSGSGCDGNVAIEGKLTTLRNGESTGIDLTGGEELTASYANESETLDENDDGSLSAQLSYSYGSGDEFVVAFPRSGNASAPRSHVTMPEDFSIDEPSSSSSHSRSKDLTVSWGGSESDAMNWKAEGSCIAKAEGTSGYGKSSFTIRANQLSGTGTCPVTLTLDRTRTAAADPAFASGSVIKAITRQRVTFSSDP